MTEREDKVVLCHAHPFIESPRHGVLYTPINERIEALLAEYFEIDLEKLEDERRAMLEELQTKVIK